MIHTLLCVFIFNPLGRLDLRHEGRQDAGGRACILLHKLAGSLPGGGEGLRVGLETVHLCGELLTVGHGDAAARRDEVFGLLEFLEVRTKQDGDAVDSRLQRIVDACPETAAHIRHFAIAVDRREQAEAIDNQALFLLYIRCLLYLRQADGGAREGAFDSGQILRGFRAER